MLWAPLLQLQRELEHQARTAYDNRAYILILKQALKLDPDNPKLLTNLGSAEYEASNYTSALSFYREVLQLDPHHNVGALLGIGTTLDSLGNHSSAVTFKDVVAASNNATDNIGKLERALALMYLQNYTIVALSVAVRYDTSGRIYHTNLP